MGTATSLHGIADVRLRQIARLIRLQRDYPGEFSASGLRLTRRAIFTLVLDCRGLGVSRDRLRGALAGKSPERRGGLIAA